jgi:hypothetical protein
MVARWYGGCGGNRKQRNALMAFLSLHRFLSWNTFFIEISDLTTIQFTYPQAYTPNLCITPASCVSHTLDKAAQTSTCFPLL